jgi:hypothetical protein
MADVQAFRREPAAGIAPVFFEEKGVRLDG